MGNGEKMTAIYTKGKEYRDSMALRKEMFKSFSQTKFHISEVYNSKQELANAAHEYAAFIVGSDQLWLPSNIEANYYTLNFVPDNVPKIALATSFGIARLPKRQAQKAAKFLKRLDFCSVRELSGQKIVKELTGREIPVVCDPTILSPPKNGMVSQRRNILLRSPICFVIFSATIQSSGIL